MKALLATLALTLLPLSAKAADYIVIDRYPAPQPVIWVEPLYRTVMDRVYVPAQYETRWIQLDGRMVQATILVHEGYYTYVERRICIREGYWTPRPYPMPVPIYRNPIVVDRPITSYDPSEHGTFSPTYDWPK